MFTLVIAKQTSKKNGRGGTFQRLGLGNGGALALPVDPYVVTCKPDHHPLGCHPPRGREGDGMRIPEFPPQKEKGKNRCLSFRRIVMLMLCLYQQ